MVTYAARMAKRPPQGRGSGGRVTPSSKPKGESTPTAAGTGRPRARVPQATEAGKAKVAKTGAKDAVRTQARAKATGSAKPTSSRDAKPDAKADSKPQPKAGKAAKAEKAKAPAEVDRTVTSTSGKRVGRPYRLAPEPEAVEDAAPRGGGLRELVTGPPAAGYVKPADRVRPWWGMGDMVLWFFVSQIVGGLGFSIIVAASGFTGQPPGLGGRVGEVVGRMAVGQAPSVTPSVADLPLHYYLVLQTPFWLGLIAGPVYAVVRKGRSLREDFGLWMTWKDVPLGLAVGVFTQIVLVSVLYKVAYLVIGEQDVSAEARKLTDRATTPGQIVALFLIVGLGAPIVEELFYRGLTQHAIAKRWGPMAGIFGSALFFAVVHGQSLQFPALLMFGLILAWLVHRFGRIGPSIWAHIGFNMVTAVSLVFTLDVPWSGT